MIKSFLHIILVIILTIVTQIGGLLWILNFGFYKVRGIKKTLAYRVVTFLLLYLITTFFIVPPLAKLNNRVHLPISKSGSLIPHNIITPLLNRHYVKPKLKSDLAEISKRVNFENKDFKVSYLDANFPFIDGFPLLPHLSHSDGRKIDLSFFYTKNTKPSKHKPSISGYGYFVDLKKDESDQTEICKSKGYWQYDFTKYLTLGSRDDLEFDIQRTKKLIQLLVKAESTHKILIEPNIKTRLQLTNDKIRFQGCHAVRHDDHLHYQVH